MEKSAKFEMIGYLKSQFEEKNFIDREDFVEYGKRNGFFSGMSLAEIESEAVLSIKTITGKEPVFTLCDCLKHYDSELCKVNPEKPRKICRSRHDCFSDCMRIDYFED